MKGCMSIFNLCFIHSLGHAKQIKNWTSSQQRISIFPTSTYTTSYLLQLSLTCSKCHTPLLGASPFEPVAQMDKETNLASAQRPYQMKSFNTFLVHLLGYATQIRNWAAPQRRSPYRHRSGRPLICFSLFWYVTAFWGWKCFGASGTEENTRYQSGKCGGMFALCIWQETLHHVRSPANLCLSVSWLIRVSGLAQHPVAAEDSDLTTRKHRIMRIQ